MALACSLNRERQIPIRKSPCLDVRTLLGIITWKNSSMEYGMTRNWRSCGFNEGRSWYKPFGIRSFLQAAYCTYLSGLHCTSFLPKSYYLRPRFGPQSRTTSSDTHNCQFQLYFTFQLLTTLLPPPSSTNTASNTQRDSPRQGSYRAKVLKLEPHQRPSSSPSIR
jgi:hypothetical protein